MMENMFSPAVQCEQFQVGQPGVKHIRHGACEIQAIDIYKGAVYYKIRIIETGLKMKCIGASLTSEVKS